MNSPAGAHLAEDEIVDALDGTLDAARLVHLTGCESCSARVEELRDIGVATAGVDVPEPPPFFWTQFSARVSSAVAAEPVPGRRFAWMHGWMRPAMTAAALAVVAIALMPIMTRNSPPPSDTTSSLTALPATEIADPDGDVFAEIDQDEAWAVVRALAEDLDHDEMDAEGVSAQPGSAEHLTLGLSETERVELAHLLQERLKDPLADSAS